MDRRNFIKKVGVATSAAFVLPRFSIAKSLSANNKINVACVGVGGIGSMTFNGIGDEANVVALCDTDLNNSAGGRKRFPNAKFFTDYREMLDKMGKDIDAVCVSTPDHSHFKIAMDSMQCGKHVSVQKPLAHDVWQVRELARAREYYKVQTQMMNQGHASSAIRMIKEWYDSGVCGAVREVHVMCSGPNWQSVYFNKPKNGFPIEKQPIPEHLKWDLWLNQAQNRDYNRIFTPLTWRSFWDYGTGMLGDWFCHTGDAPVWCMDLKDPSKIELIEANCDYDKKVFIPNSSIVKWTFPATQKRPEVVMYWYDGGLLPKQMPHDWDADRKLDPKHGGMLMVGDKHTIETGNRPTTNPRMANSAFFADFKRNMPAKTLKRVRKDNLYFEWFDAIRGDGPEAGSNFKVSSQLTEVALLGCLAQRFGGVIEWDAKNMRSPNRPELTPFIKEVARKGWETKSLA